MTLKLGLIGDNIVQSRSPNLHRLAGQQNGVDVRYDRLVPKDLATEFAGVFADCKAQGYRGINVTYPYKERVSQMVVIDDPVLKAMGTVNTVIFDADGPHGYSTDYTGFIAAYRATRNDDPAGIVTMIGAGGVGRAVAFGLSVLGTTELRLVDRDPAKAEALAEALQSLSPNMKISIWIDAEKAAAGATGVVNCTPVGMVGIGGTPLPRTAMSGAKWAFDAVYTPTDTPFLVDAAAEGLDIISGWELFFYQGVHAWRLFADMDLDQTALRQDLLALGDLL